MAKRKKKAETAVIPTPVKKSDALKKFYQTGAWAGIPQYRCTLCNFDTLHKDVMIDHLQVVHHIGKKAVVPSATAANNDVTDQGADSDLNGMFEIELEEVSSTTDEQGNEHKKFTIKE